MFYTKRKFYFYAHKSYVTGKREMLNFVHLTCLKDCDNDDNH
jgi:hypothetical protein